MQIAPNARQHDVPDKDIRHAVSHATVAVTDENDAARVLFLGPDRAGRPLEVVVIDGDVVIHAMPMRAKFNHYLTGG